MKIDKIEFPTRKKEITNANIIEVEAGTTGFKGGDSGHGGRTYFRIEDLASTDMKISFHAEMWPGAGMEQGTMGKIHGWDMQCSMLELEFGGDAELETFIEALQFSLDTLKEQAGLKKPNMRETPTYLEAVQDITLQAWPALYGDDNKYDKDSRDVLDLFRDWAEEFEAWWYSLSEDDRDYRKDYDQEIALFTDKKIKETLKIWS